jgi:molybdate transport system substrate-binding protein
VLLTILAAASLTNVFPAIDRHERYSFGGSNALAAQIRQGAPADVFASADTALPRQLYRARLVEKPVVFTHNALTLIVPRSNPAHIRRVADLHGGGVKLVVAAPGVPVGDYTRTVLRRMHQSGVLRNVVSEETDVRDVLAKVALGEADAGFVYRTDARTVRAKVRMLALPRSVQPRVSYAVAVLRGSAHAPAARRWVHRQLAKTAQAKLRTAGFLARR